ncbi:MAG: GntR family transcriptional regulator [Eubacteriales bacterium]
MQLYKEIVNDIKEKILLGELKQGDKLPSENEMQDIYNASKTTINKSLMILANENLINTVPKVGNFIARSQKNYYNIKYNIFDNMSVMCDKHTILFKNITQKNDCYELKLCELLYIEKIPFAYDIKYIYAKEKKHLLSFILNDTDHIVLFDTFKNVFNVKKSISIEANFCPSDIQQYLHTDENSLVMQVQCKYTEKDHITAESITYFKNDYFSLTATIASE